MLLFRNAFIKRTEKYSCSGADGVGRGRYEWGVGALHGSRYGWRVANMDGTEDMDRLGYVILFEMEVGTKKGGLEIKGIIPFTKYGIERDQ